MSDDQQYDYTTDPQFLKAPATDQHDYLMSVDKDYAKASTADQQEYLQSISGNRRDTTKETLALISPQGRAPKKADIPRSPMEMQGEGEEIGAADLAKKGGAYVAAGPKEMYEGAKEAAVGTVHGAKGWGKEVPEGLHRTYAGAMTTAAPLIANVAPIGALSAPATTALGLGAGYGGGKLTRYGAEKAHLPPAWQDVSEDAGQAAFGYAGAKVGSAIDSALTRNPLESATDVYQRATKPNKITPEEQDTLRNDFQRAAPHIKEELGEEKLKTGAGGVKRASEVAGDAAERIWNEQVEPVREQFADVESHGRDVAKAIRSSLTDLDETKPGVVKAANKLAEHFDKDMTIAEKFDEVKELNNDKTVARYYSMTPAEKTAAELGDPGLRAKVTALNALRESLFQDVSKAGGDELGDAFQRTRKDFGALKSVQRRLYEDTKIKSPQGVLSRLANAIGSPRQTALDAINNPENLAPRAFNKLRGIDELQAPETLPARPVPQYAAPERGQLGLPSIASPDATIRGPLFEQGTTEPQPMEMSKEKLMKLNMKLEEQQDILRDVDATAAEKAAAKTKLNSTLLTLDQLRGGVQKLPTDVRSIYEPAMRDFEIRPEIRPNASGESSASREAINRVASEKTNAVKRFRIDTRSGREVPLIGVDAVDAKPGPYDVIVKRSKTGEEILDTGAKARPYRAKK